jgi:hypothetical protein
MHNASHLKVCNEGVISLLDGLARELEELAAPRCLPHGFLQVAISHFQDEGFDGCHDAFEAVTAPTGRAGEDVLGLRVSRALHFYVTRAAKDALGIVSH